MRARKNTVRPRVMSQQAPPPTEADRINRCLEAVSQIANFLRMRTGSLEQYITQARNTIHSIGQTNFMEDRNRFAQQIYAVDTLQHLAYHRPEYGAVEDIATWCSNQWLILFRRDPVNVQILTGIGQAWFWRAQPSLARLQQRDRIRAANDSNGSPSSSRSGENGDNGSPTEAQLGDPDHVEARALLQPALEYLERAVSAATTQSALNGQLLSTTAQSYMSLGNVSDPRINERYFQRAIELLRSASRIPGYRLSVYLQRYLDSYGRYFQES